MNVYPNLTLVLLQVSLLVTIFALNALILKPMLQYLEEREEKSGGAESNAGEINVAIDQKVEQLTTEIKAAQQQAAEIRESARSEAAAEYTDAIQVFFAKNPSNKSRMLSLLSIKSNKLLAKSYVVKLRQLQ